MLEIHRHQQCGGYDFQYLKIWSENTEFYWWDAGYDWKYSGSGSDKWQQAAGKSHLPYATNHIPSALRLSTKQFACEFHQNRIQDGLPCGLVDIHDVWEHLRSADYRGWARLYRAVYTISTGKTKSALQCHSACGKQSGTRTAAKRADSQNRTGNQQSEGYQSSWFQAVWASGWGYHHKLQAVKGNRQTHYRHTEPVKWYGDRDASQLHG